MLSYRVRLSYFDPDAMSEPPEARPPVLTSRTVDVREGLFGKNGYIVKLDEPYVVDFAPLHPEREQILGRPVEWLLMAPAPGYPTREVARDHIGEALADGRVTKVMVALGRKPEDLANPVLEELIDTELLALLSATLERIPDF